MEETSTTGPERRAPTPAPEAPAKRLRCGHCGAASEPGRRSTCPAAEAEREHMQSAIAMEMSVGTDKSSRLEACSDEHQPTKRLRQNPPQADPEATIRKALFMYSSSNIRACVPKVIEAVFPTADSGSAAPVKGADKSSALAQGHTGRDASRSRSSLYSKCCAHRSQEPSSSSEASQRTQRHRGTARSTTTLT